MAETNGAANGKILLTLPEVLDQQVQHYQQTRSGEITERRVLMSELELQERSLLKLLGGEPEGQPSIHGRFDYELKHERVKWLRSVYEERKKAQAAAAGATTG